MRGERGFQLMELMVALALFGLLAATALPDLLSMTRRWQVRMAAVETAMALHRARATAIRQGFAVGVKFRTAADGTVSFQLYRDGDGDGVRNADIDGGIDPPLSPPRRLDHFGPRVGFSILHDPPPRDPGSPGRRLDRPEDPIRFNRSDIASFGPLGTSSNGSLYLSDHRDYQAAVRVFGPVARIRVLVYDRDSETWSRR